MSTAYYLVCRPHNEGVYITNSNGNPFIREDVMEFLYRHLECPITLVNEHILDHEDVKIICAEFGDE